MKINYVSRATIVAAICLISFSHATAQIVNVDWIGNTGSYSDGSNWSSGFPPHAGFDEVGFIDNGGMAILDSMPTGSDPGPGALTLGSGAGDSGSVEIQSGGQLNVHIPNLAVVSGEVTVGQGGEGHLTVLRGGGLEAVSLRSGGANASSIVLGQTDGSGTATVSIEGTADLNRITRVIGPNVDFSAGSVDLDNAHTLVAEITGAAHSLLKADSAFVRGALQVDFNGPTPTLGDTWNLIDAGSISGGFSNITSNAPLAPGEGLLATTVAGGANGQLLQLAVDVQLVLSVGRRSGMTSINNLSAGGTVDLDGYAILSTDRALDPSAWSSFTDAGQADWSESNPNEGHLTELSLGSSRTIASESTIDLGAVYNFIPTTFGESEGPLTFQYTSSAGTFDGRVELSGPRNHLVLTVDPITGEAAIQNQSTFDLSIDGYEIESVAGSLDASQWVSLADSDADWTEANPASNHIGELHLSGSRDLGGESDAISLGQIFTPGAERDLVFTFSAASVEGGESGLFTGIIDYEQGPIDFDGTPTIAGDYDSDDFVGQGDIDLVLLNWGADVSGGAPNGWTSNLPTGSVDQDELDQVLLNWGNSAAAGSLSAAGVPEPTSAMLLMGAAACLFFFRLRR